MVRDWRYRGALAACALALDWMVGDPPDALHPVAWFGNAMARRERTAWRDDRAAGVLHLLIGAVAAAASASLLRTGARRVGGLRGDIAFGTVIAAMVIGARSLDRRAAEIEDALAAGRLADARAMLPALVGRDPQGLDEAEIARAVVESVAENSVDAVVAPLIWLTVGGPAGVSAYRAINTLDAMVGHRSDRYRNFGWASARADDVANYVPARVAATVVGVLSPRRAKQVFGAVRRQAPGHPSPNAGVIEAAFAGALGVRLGGSNNYGGALEERVRLGDGPPPVADDICKARALARRLYVAVGLALAAPFALDLARTPRRAAQ